MYNDYIVYERVNVMKLNITANLPTHCPECGSELQWDGVNLVCDNEVCSGKRYYKLYKFISSIGGNGLKGFGHSMINDIIDISTKSPLIKNDSSIEEYMQEAQVAMISILNSTYIEDNYGSATARKYRTAFENMLINPVDKNLFLWSMNIKGLGWKTCQQLVSEGILDKILKYDSSWEDNCRDIKGIGQSVIQSLHNNANYIRFMAQWIKNNFIEEVKTENNESLRYVTVTGALQSMSRSDFDKFIHQYGWAVDANISNSEYLVTNNPDPTSSKGKKAKALGKQIITESAFLDLIKENPITDPKSPIEVGELCE